MTAADNNLVGEGSAEEGVDDALDAFMMRLEAGDAVAADDDDDDDAGSGGPSEAVVHRIRRRGRPPTTSDGNDRSRHHTSILRDLW
jgi:hypothetical protein